MAELEWQILRVTSQFSSLKESWNSATVMMDDIADLDERISGFAQHILMNRPSEEELHLHTRLGMLHNFLLVLQQQVQSRHQMSFSSEDNFAKGKQRWINAGKFYHLVGSA